MVVPPAKVLLAGQRIGMCDSFSGQFGFPLPPGSYTLYVNKQISGRKAEKALTVEAGKTVTVQLDLLL